VPGVWQGAWSRFFWTDGSRFRATSDPSSPSRIQTVPLSGRGPRKRFRFAETRFRLSGCSKGRPGDAGAR